MSECQKDLMAEGKPYPRTCSLCGLFGPCAKGYDPKWTADNPVGVGPGYKAGKAKGEPVTFLDMVERVRQLEGEVFALRQELAQLKGIR